MLKRSLSFVTPALLLAATMVSAADREATLSPKAPARLQGTVAAGDKETWILTITGGKQARISLVKGRREVIADLEDPQGITPNEGVDEQEWFPVEPGRYKVTVTNVTALEKKANGHSATYEVKVEVK